MSSDIDGNDTAIGHIDKCQICRSNDMQQIVDLGFSAPCDSLLTSEQLKQPETVYPLNLVRCRECGLVQIDHAVDPKKLFHYEYPYRSGITEILRNNLHGIARHVSEKLRLADQSLVVDIGSNDGTILEGFKNIGMRVLGVEPTQIAKIAIVNGINTINEFFSPQVASTIMREHGKASVVTAANLFAHVNALSDLTRGVGDLLIDDGMFVTESHYMLDILETLQYDSVYHEHLRFYLLKPLQLFFDDHGFTLIDVERIPNYGGSIRVYAKKGSGHPVAQRVEDLIRQEEKVGAYDDKTYNAFADRVRASRRAIRSLVVNLTEKGERVVGIGCPGRAITLLSYCGLSSDLLPYIAEQSSSLKLDLYTPGSHIPVVDEVRMFEEQPAYGLILSWHYADPIIRKLREKGLRSKIIVPLPEVRIVD